jgi:hypothetical protein
MPVYRPGDNKDAQDEAYHEILNKLYENKLKLWEDEIYQKRWGVQRKSPSKEDSEGRDENDKVPKARKKKKICVESTTNKEQMKPRKPKRLEPHEPQECLTLQSLVNDYYCSFFLQSLKLLF